MMLTDFRMENVSDKKLVESALKKARDSFDDYNHMRYSQMQVMVTHGNKLTVAERHDLWSYLN